MKQLSSSTGVVSDKTLFYQQDTLEISTQLDSSDWYTWLAQARSFSFKSDDGSFTAYKARTSNKRGGWYWYAYRHRNGRFYRSYLGTSSKLTLNLLRDTARQLAQRGEAQQLQPDITLDVPSLEHKQNQILDTIPAYAQETLLATKFHIPRLPAHYIARARLREMLDQVKDARLTLVSAPAGSGKTTLLAAWARATTLPTTWLSLEEADDNPQRFLSYIVTALSTKFTEPVRISPRKSWEETLTHLVNDLAHRLVEDTVFILDDYHLISSEPIHRMLQFLIDHAPATLHLLIGTRHDPSFPLIRLRARDQLREIRTDALRFSSAEVQAFLQAMKLDLSTDELHAVEQQTQGWAVAVQLLTLALCRHSNPASLLHNTSVQHLFLDYISEEILTHLPITTRRFLVETSIMPRLTGALCDAITGQSDGQEQLVDLYQGNLLHMLDDTGIWYTYHPLFAESLRTHLQKQEPGLIPELYRRASSWYEEQGYHQDACEYAFQAGDLTRATALLTDLVPFLMAQEKMSCLSEWITRLSPEVVAKSPQLWFAAVWTQCSHGALDEVVKRLEEQVATHAHEANSPWNLHKELALFQAWAALAENNHPRTIELMQNALHTRSEGALSHLIAVHQSIALSTAYRENGDLDAAEQVLLQATSSHTNEVCTDRFLNVLARASLAELYEARGWLHKLNGLYQEMTRTLDMSGCVPLPFLALTLARRAILLYEWNYLQEADTVAQQAMEMARQLKPPVVSVPLLCFWVQARIARAQGDNERANQLLEHVEHELAPFSEQATLLWDTLPTNAIPARLAIINGRLELAEHWLVTDGANLDLPPAAYLSGRYSHTTTQARLLLARGYSQRNSSLFTQALALLDHLHHTIRQMGNEGWLMEIHLLTALTLQAQGKTKRALETLGSVVTQAEPEGYIRLFADEGQPMAPLLAQVGPYTTASPAYVQKLQAAMAPLQEKSATAKTSNQQALIEPLSPREREVLHLLAEGYSNQQIAQQLVISPHTVKLHVRHIFAKLVATNRTQAVTRARELQIL